MRRAPIGKSYVLKMRALGRTGLERIISEEFLAANDGEARKFADEIIAAENEKAVGWKCVPVALYAERQVEKYPR